MLPDPVWTSRSTGPLTFKVREKEPSARWDCASMTRQALVARAQASRGAAARFVMLLWTETGAGKLLMQGSDCGTVDRRPETED